MPVTILDGLAAALARARRLPRGGALGVLGGVLATLLGTAALVAAFVWPGGPAAPAAGSSPSVGTTPATTRHPGAAGQQLASAAVSASPSASARPVQSTSSAVPSRTAAPAPLTARFAKRSDGLAGYPATVTIANPGTAPAPGWTVTLTLPRNTLEITDVSGATVTRDGAVWTFVPVADTAQVGGGRSVTVSFRVGGAALFDAAPTGCTIDGNPCQGL